MPFVQAKCPECGGMLAVDDSKKAAMCQFCGEAFIVQEAVNNYNTYNTTNNTYNNDNRTTHNYSDGTVVNVYEDTSKDFVIEVGVLKEYHGAAVDVIIPESVAEISPDCFSGLKIKSVVIPNGVKSIEANTFNGCTNLVSITIPDSVEKIGATAFKGCINLTTITIGNGCKSLGREVFSDCPSLISINVDMANTIFSSLNGILFNSDKTTLIRYPVNKMDSEYIIPDSVKTIGVEAFCGCVRLKSVTIPNSVNSIGDNAFMSCRNLTRITILDSVTHMGKDVFKDTPYYVEFHKKELANRFAEKKAVEQAEEAEKQRIIAERKRNGLCQHCGGTFKGLFSSKCSNCGKPKDY